MSKFTNKRDADRHVAQMTKNLSESEVIKMIQFFSLAFLKNANHRRSKTLEMIDAKFLSCENVIELTVDQKLCESSILPSFYSKDFSLCCFCTSFHCSR